MAKLLDVPCTIANCDGKQMAKGWCWKHYSRARRWGDPLRSDTVRRDVERFWFSFTRDESGCWLWTGPKNAFGYGIFNYGEAAASAHRYSYTLLVEPVSREYDVHHTCQVRHCVNPMHLEPIPYVEHRAEHARSRWAIQDPAELLRLKALVATGAPVLRIARDNGYERTVIRQVKKGVYDALLDGGVS